ncbi:MAG: hypothetical protein U0835_13765 [Isosphaeraceae bacterium]
MCERASTRDASDTVRSELADWKAVAQAELKFPAELVRATFEESIRLDPSNALARRNLDAFNRSSEPTQPQPGRWEIRPEAAVRASGMAVSRREPASRRGEPAAA